MSDAYKDSGVNLNAGYEAIKRITNHIERTRTLGMMGKIGSFGGMFDLSIYNFKEPILVSGTDGVGTKLKIAMMANKHDTIGIDVVAMCVNDVLAQGALPLFFLDYIAIGKNNPSKIEAIVKGVADGCVLANCALIGGETAEMPDMYGDDEYDIAGFTVGAVEKSKIITSEKVRVNDVVIGIASSGLHSNGFSLVRKILFKDNKIDINMMVDNKPLKELLLTPTKIYVEVVKKLLSNIDIKGISHITGGGFIENLPRCIKSNQAMLIDKSSFEILPVFKYLQDLGQLDENEMFNIFNMGIGMAIIVDENDVNKALKLINSCNEKAYVIGRVINGTGVIFK